MRRTFLKSLVAVVTGNLLYYFALMPLLPPAGRHEPGRLDLGLVLDFWICLVIFGIVDFFTRRSARRSTRTDVH